MKNKITPIKFIIVLIISNISLLYGCRRSDDVTINSLHKQITSGRVNTYKKFSFKYGKVFVNAKIPRTANGLWPAPIWFLGADFNGYSPDGKRLLTTINANWPQCAEIDLVEMGAWEGIQLNTQSEFLTRGCHWGENTNGNNHPNYIISSNYGKDLQDDFHVFALSWDETFIHMYINPIVESNNDIIHDKNINNCYYEMRIDKYDGDYPVGNYFHKEFFVIMNLAAGGGFTNIFEIDKITALNNNNNYEAKMYIDYIKVYGKDGNLLWQDLFDNSTINQAYWNIEENSDGGGNYELQIYTPKNVLIGIEPETGKSCLILKAKKE